MTAPTTSIDAATEVLERIWDPETARQLSTLEIDRGWRCFTSASGAGRLARWLAATVSPGGCVLTSSTRGIPDPPILRMGTDDPLPASLLDLVHLRVWRAGELRSLPSLVASLKPGRWLVLEALDWGTLPDALALGLEDPHLGRGLLARLRNEGLEGAQAVAHATIGDVAARFGIAPVAGDGDPFSPLMVTAWARRPAHEDSATDRREEGTLAVGEPNRREE